MAEVFISYKSNDPQLGNNDGTVANELCKAIEAAGITCWIAPRDIPGGSRYDDEIVDAIEGCKAILVVFSEHTYMSKWMPDEARLAYENGKTVFSFIIDDSQFQKKWKLYLGGSQKIDASGDYRERIPELISALRHKLGKIDFTPTCNNDTIPSQSESIVSNPSIETFTVNGVSFNMVRVEGGTFTMGFNDCVNDFSMPHQVTLSSYYIGETPVTQELWKVVMGKNPSKRKVDVQCPVDRVSWNDCQDFIVRLNKLTGLCFRLPTEAEWEFAARGGIKSKGFNYSGSNILDDVAWFNDNSRKRSHPVCTKKANEIGLFDMTGNVYEWCQDKWGKYRTDSQTNPTGSVAGNSRLCRGGSWLTRTWEGLDVYHRNCFEPSEKGSFLGFRLAL